MRIAHTLLILITLIAASALASDLPRITMSEGSVVYGGSSGAKSVVDTIYLIGPWGSDPVVNGQFQSQYGGIPEWHGWTSRDLTEPEGINWHVSDYHAVSGNLSAYCGDETMPACSESDEPGGYGNSWHDVLEFRYTVPNPQNPCTMTVSGVFNHNTEQGYDFIYLRVLTAGGVVAQDEVDGTGESVPFSHTLEYQPGDYMGVGNDEIAYRIRFNSDGAWSDEDCLFYSHGAAQFDDIQVIASNGSYSNFEDFEDGDLGLWNTVTDFGVGDFAQLWTHLEDIDPCITNYSPQVAFIDDGVVVPGVGPSECINWCYGPFGYIVNTTGGRLLNEGYIHNTVMSPVITWPGAEYDGCLFEYDVYRHEDLSHDAPGIFYTWAIRSAADPADIEDANWEDRAFVNYGGPGYLRDGGVVGDLLDPDRTAVQVRMAVYELGWVWGWTGDDGYPAPYFDNVRLLAYEKYGPALNSRTVDLAQDNFPATGILDLEDLSSNSVRFDMAQAKGWGGDPHNVPGDSITVDVSPTRDGGIIIENRMHYSLQRNPLFDAVRDPAWGPTGYVDGRPAVNASGNAIPDRFAYDLPDSGFLFPGDILHYYFSAVEDLSGEMETATLPGDISHFGNFDTPHLYDDTFVIRALPTVHGTYGDQPRILFWNDAAGRGKDDDWYWALKTAGFSEGDHYDRYDTSAPTSGLGNGLGGRCTPELMAGYDVLIYTSGDLGYNTISNGDLVNDGGDDVGLLTQWAEDNRVGMLLCGDDLATSLNGSGTETQAFLENIMNVDPLFGDIRPYIGNQTSPHVVALENNSMFQYATDWRLMGGCPGINTFDAVYAGTGAEILAEFLDPGGQPGYGYSAATLNPMEDGSRIVSLPYDLMYVEKQPYVSLEVSMSRRALILREVVERISYAIWPFDHSATPDAQVFSASNHPNPFNPVTRIDYNLPHAGRLEIRVFDVRGHKVATLLDEQRAAGSGHIMWDGKDDAGASVGSGVYFYEARAAGEVKVGKMTLLK